MTEPREGAVAAFVGEIGGRMLGFDFDSVEATRLRNLSELAIAAYHATASVPEKLFAVELLEYLIRFEPDLEIGRLNEEDIEEIEADGCDYWKEFGGNLEMFINPRDLFLGGNIRPDIVFRKGKGNYLVFEVDSFQYHSSQDQLMKDKIRERKIQSLGYPVFRFAAKEILNPAGAYACAIEAIEILKEHGFLTKKET